jgi:hypothetical protein
MKFALALFGLITLLATTGCEYDEHHHHRGGYYGGYYGEYPQRYYGRGGYYDRDDRHW